ncbi:hypothetical protein BH09MYX1_BH09MYX1_12190 [soil metagenome]
MARTGSLVLAVVLLASCGYRSVYAVPSEKLHVHLARVTIADAAAAVEVENGAREYLAREGALASGEGYPRLEIDVLRIDETSEGIAATPAGTPQARATRLGVLGRATLVPRAGEAVSVDTGDVRAADLVTVPSDPGAELVGRADSLRAIARKLGQKLAARALGHASPTEIEAQDP